MLSTDVTAAVRSLCTVRTLLGFRYVVRQVRELEGELESEQRRNGETQKTIRRQERRIHELTELSEDDEKARYAERETIEKLQSKLKQYKRELDDAVSIAASVPRKLSRDIFTSFTEYHFKVCDTIFTCVQNLTIWPA